MGANFFPSLHHWLMTVASTTSLHLFYFVLASGVMFGPGRWFSVKGFPALLRGAPDMNSLGALGTTAAYGYSVLVTLDPQPLPAEPTKLNFEADAVIVTVILVDHLVNQAAKGRTGHDLPP